MPIAVDRFGRKVRAEHSQEFERGARVAAAPPAADLSRPLESEPGDDHMAALELRRIEMIQEWDRKVNDLKARAADVHSRAVKLHLETNDKARAGNTETHLLQEAQRQVNLLLDDERRILRSELPALEFERANIVSHPTYVALRTCAEGRVQNDLVEKQNRITGNFETAHKALHAHLASIATDETRRLASALIDASKAAKIKPDYTVQQLVWASDSRASA